MTKSTTPKNIVLYADDDPDDLQLVQEAFAEYAKNVEVVTMLDGGQMLNYLEKLPEFDPIPCLIILDINMPIVDGKKVLRRIREMDRFESVPVVLFSTSSMPGDKAFASNNKAGFITKPLNVHQMEIITDQFIEHCAEEIRKKIRKAVD